MMDALLDDATVDAILDGSLPPDVPAALGRLAEVVDRARVAEAKVVSARDVMVIGAMVAAAREANPPALHHARRRVARGLKATLVIGAFLGSGAAAAATGHLPPPVQRAVSGAAAHAGIGLPDHARGDDPTEPGSADSSESSDAPASQGNGPDVGGPAAGGLCTAHAARVANGNTAGGGTAEQDLEAAAAAAGETVDEYCATATASSPTDTAPAAPDPASSDSSKPSAGKGPPSSLPPTANSNASPPSDPPGQSKAKDPKDTPPGKKNG
jgi:hypothetical protein